MPHFFYYFDEDLAKDEPQISRRLKFHIKGGDKTDCADDQALKLLVSRKRRRGHEETDYFRCHLYRFVVNEMTRNAFSQEKPAFNDLFQVDDFGFEKQNNMVRLSLVSDNTLRLMIRALW